MKVIRYLIAGLIYVLLLFPMQGATISLFSAKVIREQTRSWNGPKDASGTITVSIENDSLVVKAVVNDDRTAQNGEDLDIGEGDHIEIWLSFADGAKLHLGFSPGKRRDYIEWVLEAKREETRAKRIETIVAQVAEGKDRNWKYKSC